MENNNTKLEDYLNKNTKLEDYLNKFLTPIKINVLSETVKDNEYRLYFKDVTGKEFEYKKVFSTENDLITIITSAHKFLDIFKQSKE